FTSPAAEVSPILHRDQHKSATDSNGRALATPKKKRKIEKDGQTHSSPIDVEEPLKTEKEDTQSVKTEKEDTQSVKTKRENSQSDVSL
ncbi:MAG: hypothetical protein L6R42_011435, partial [Xanthoria sp. 1 TBL-2021]